MLYRRLAWIIAAMLVVGAGVAASWQVQVHGAAGTRACGSAVDVVSGRTGWQRWWAADTAEDSGAEAPLLRTERCPGAENRRLLLVAGLGFAALVALGAVEVALRLAGHTGAAPAGTARRPVDRLRTLGRLVVGLGGILTAAGVTAVTVLLANPDATLFLYVSRPVVALLGALALLPAIALMAAGRVLDLLARSIASAGSSDAGP